jgi:hypothetical protein
MQADKSLLEHMTDAMSDFATRAKKTAKKVKRTMAGRPAKKTKSSAGRKELARTRRPRRWLRRRQGVAADASKGARVDRIQTLAQAFREDQTNPERQKAA